MRKTVTLLTLSLFLAAYVQAQHAFRILASQGDNKIMKGSTWTTLTAGTKIYKGNKVQIGQGGYAGMMHKSGKTIELRTAGVYDLSQLEGKLSSKSSSFAEKYAKFAMSDMNGGDGYKTSYNTTGSVTRGDEDAYFVAQGEVNLVPNIPITLTWMYDPQYKTIPENIQLRVINMFDEVVDTVKVARDRAVTYTLSEEVSKKQIAFFTLWDLDNNVDITDGSRIKIKLVEPEASKRIIAEYESLQSELSVDSPMDNLVLASFFEENKMVDYTISSLAKASVLATEVPDFKNTFMNYVIEKTEVDAETIKLIIKEEKGETEETKE